MKWDEWQRICLLQIFKKEIQKRVDQIIWSFCRIGFPQEIRPRLFNLRKFSKTERNTTESWTMLWNQINDKEFRSSKCLKFKYRRGDQIIHLSAELFPPKKLGSPSLIWGNFQKLRNTTESCRMHWNEMIDEEFGSSKFLKRKYRRGTK